jgi:hypothetical protein
MRKKDARNSELEKERMRRKQETVRLRRKGGEDTR